MSDTIKGYPKGNELQEGRNLSSFFLACLKALRAVGSEVPPGVHLLSNREGIVISLLPESDAPIQK